MFATISRTLLLPAIPAEEFSLIKDDQPNPWFLEVFGNVVMDLQQIVFHMKGI
jgi:hypothetical protein